MNRLQKEVQQAFIDSEKAVLKELEASYRDALIEIDSKLSVLLARQDVDLEHVIYQVEHQKALRTQVQSILEGLQAKEFETLSGYFTRSYTDGFLGTMYDIKGQGIPLIIPIDQKQVLAAIQHETKLSSKLYTELGHDIGVLQKNIAGEISRGIASGMGYPQIARNIANYAKIPKNRAMTIARTESHRIQCKATSDAQFEAKKKGADVVKQWDAALDGDTRPNHRQLDGQIRELEERFEVGKFKPRFPGDFGNPGEDCNCRCALLQRARWALDESELETLKERAAYYGLDKTKDFEDYKKKYLKASEQEQVRSNAQKMKDDDISDYISSKKKYDSDAKKLKKMEAENDELFDEYNAAIDTPKELELEKIWEQKYDELESFREIMKDFKSQLAGKEAKAVRHIEKNLANMLNIDVTKVNMTGLPYESADMVYQSYKVVLNKYPELRGHLTQFDFDGVYGRAYAGCYALQGKVVAHGDFKNFDDLVKKYADDVLEKFHPLGTDHNSIIVHELGHAMDGYMTKKGMFDGKITAYGDIRSAVEVRKQVLDRLGWTFERTKTLRESLKSQGLSYKEINSEIEKQRNAFIKEHISEYACDNEKEFFAECFAEYVMSDNPREAAKIFGEIIDKGLGR